MYIVCGSNLHGQWFHTNPVLNEFQQVSVKDCEYSNYDIDINEIKFIHIGWSYNLLQHKNTFYLIGSFNGKNKELVKLPLPTKVIPNNKLLLSGNEYNLFLFEIQSHTMWVVNLENIENVKIINMKTEIPSTIKRYKEDDPIVKVCTSNYNFICLTAEGAVYSGILPGPLDVSHCFGKVCDVQCGYEHYLLLTDKGRVYSWGNGRRLQLGHGDLNSIDSPKELEALSGIHITMISAGGWHSLALSESGDLYAWGWNETGQLGIKETEPVNNDLQKVHQDGPNSYGHPTLVDIFNENGDICDTNVKYISCGNLHSAIILDDNTVWTAGCNNYGQLGFAIETTKQNVFFQKAYQCLENSLIKCGPWVTVIYSYS
ncbi:RCC1 domain-containing protein 1-like [Leguminivora glycinivorella]|uniref:RCC1 domain-containing protein 1-like n=1 Tax=Leguminivora glycinivorella TaxID=1035111 RepID=UPI0020105AE8|nr:RCC1 domain-containing protein 1-like [Leguminivora glycinivorella]